MAEILSLTGGSALSPFREAKLLQGLRASRRAAGIVGFTSHFQHFIELASPLSDGERRTLELLLIYGPKANAVASAASGMLLLVVPRPGTISPWSSKATDIAKNCGLNSIRRIERGVAHRVLTADSAPLTTEQRDAVLPLIHDRMTETVFFDLADAQALFAHFPPKRLAAIPLMENGRAALAQANSELGLALTFDEIDYLERNFRALQRDPTDVELMMFAQANSEHCRHKIFNAKWIIDGKHQEHSLFDLIRKTHAAHPHGTVVAYADNAAIIAGSESSRFHPQADGRYTTTTALIHTLIKVETHNHPTAIAPFPGAATGAGGEIRDEGATGVGGKPKAGLVGYTVSHLRIPTLPQPWEREYGLLDRIAPPLAIMLEGPIGAASFNNEFGRPNLAGYFRTFEQEVAGEMRGYHKPIMLAGGLGNIAAEHVHKSPLPAGTLLLQLGGPGFLIGIGGGAASSMDAGVNTAELDYDSVQRGNAEMQRRAQEVIDRCAQLGAANPLRSLHDVGAGGLSNALPELVHGGGAGGTFELRAVPSEETGMAPREIWCNEAQERYVLAIAPAELSRFAEICARERCPFAVVGHANDEGRLVVADAHFGNRPVDVPLDVILGKPPQMTRDVAHATRQLPPLKLVGVTVKDAADRVLQFPAVADKTFLVTIGDRTVGGLCSRDPMVGPWQVPVADVAVTLMDFAGYAGEAMAIGERTPLALIDPPASGRMAVGEAITNLAAASIGRLDDVKLSANWMAAAGHPGEDAELYDTVRAVALDTCIAIGLSIPVGKDSLSMRTAWSDDGVAKAVTAPISLIVSAFAPIADARKTLTPLLRLDRGETALVLIDLAAGRRRLGASTLAQVYGQLGCDAPDLDDPQRLLAFFALIQRFHADGSLFAYHDVSDGGLFVTLVEMAFASRCGLDVLLDAIPAELLPALFAEELGAVVQVRADGVDRLCEAATAAGLTAYSIGSPTTSQRIRISCNSIPVLDESRVVLHRAWSATTHALQRLRDNPDAADQEYARLLDADDPGIVPTLTFDPNTDVAGPFIGRGARPKVAILREQGVNGQVEMAAAFDRAGFAAYDVHMTDLLAGRFLLGEFAGLAACGGFSYGDVLGAGEGWAKSILFNSRLRAEFAVFFARADTFALGICNGCQMFSNLRVLIPGTRHWPHFVRNRSEQFEARFVTVEVHKSPSLFFTGMQGSRIPITAAHGEGYAEFPSSSELAAAQPYICLRFVDNRGAATETYPYNSNGSPQGITGLTTTDGRVTILMPHPERVHRTVQMSWHPDSWGEDSPWMRMFRNARLHLG
ncbi:MAG: phosphoribosylformylglycinamidine synthase [Casimicrobiaceae bacterium]